MRHIYFYREVGKYFVVQYGIINFVLRFAEHGWFRFLENFGSTFREGETNCWIFFWRVRAEHQWSLAGKRKCEKGYNVSLFLSPYYVQIAHGMSQKGEGGRGGGCIYFRAVRTVLKQNAWIFAKKICSKIQYLFCSSLL